MAITVRHRSLNRYALLLLVILITAAPASYAVRVPGLYEAEVPVSGQQPRDRVLAFQAGMRMVLIKLTGDRNAPLQPDLSPLIRDAERYIQQYRYVESRTTPVGTAAPEGQLNLKLWFDETNLTEALRNLGVNIWSSERPSVLVWLAIEQGNIRRLLQLEEDPEYFSTIDNQARARGIVLMFPLFDLEDTANLQVGDIWGGFHGQVLNASQRYSPDIILTGRIESPLEGIWQAQWTGYFGSEAKTWTTEGSFPETVLNEGLDGIVDLLAQQFGRGTSQTAGEVQMRIVDIVNVEQYARVLRYLNSLSPVTRVDIVRASQGDILFSISAHGGAEAVTQAINFGRILEPVDQLNNIYRLTR
jgi:hypothetical protein